MCVCGMIPLPYCMIFVNQIQEELADGIVVVGDIPSTLIENIIFCGFVFPALVLFSLKKRLVRSFGV